MDRLKQLQEISRQIEEMVTREIDDFEFTLRSRGFSQSRVDLILEHLGYKALHRAQAKKDPR